MSRRVAIPVLAGSLVVAALCGCSDQKKHGSNPDIRPTSTVGVYDTLTPSHAPSGAVTGFVPTPSSSASPQKP